MWGLLVWHASIQAEILTQHVLFFGRVTRDMIERATVLRLVSEERRGATVQ